MANQAMPSSVPADPSQWSAKSQRSVSSEFTTEYRDITYSCWRCQKASVFTAADQQYTYEIKKAPIDQKRVLCETCWREGLVLERDIKSHEQKWAEAKESLKKDAPFLSRWLELLTLREQYVPYRSNIAAKNMLRKLLEEIA